MAEMTPFEKLTLKLEKDKIVTYWFNPPFR